MPEPRSSAIEPVVPLADGEYLRSFDAQIDVLDAARIFVRGRMRDAHFDLEHTWVLTTPEYEVIEAGAILHRGDEIAPELCERYRAITGTRIGRGFSRRILDALGEDLAGSREHLLLAIEMARVGQQIYQFPAGFDERFERDPQARSADALLCWQKDRAYMGALADSCYTYRDASAELFKSRLIVSIVGPQITQPAPGSAFWRRKHLSLRALGDDGPAFLCESAMEDPLHHIAVGFRLGADGTISAAHSRALRLPYSGLCEEPQLRSARLNGLRLSPAFVGEIAERIGGAQGCTHLFDLTVDCLRLFKL